MTTPATSKDFGHTRAVFGDNLSPANITVISSGAAGVKYVEIMPFLVQGQINLGLTLQASAGVTITTAITVFPTTMKDLLRNDAVVPWKTYTAITNGDILNLGFVLGTYLKLTFSGPGSVAIACM